MNSPEVPAKPERLDSMDAYRGFVMLLMMDEVLDFCGISGNGRKQ